MCANFQTKWTTLSFWAQICPNGFFVSNFKNVSLDSESAPPRYHVSQFSVKIDNFEFFQPKFGEIAQLRAIFWFEYC